MHNETSEPTAPPVPGGLTGDQAAVWLATARPDHTTADRALLKLYVRWVSQAEQMLILAAQDPSDLGRANAATTATVNALRLADALGIGPAARKAVGVVEVKPVKRAGRPIRSLDELTPTRLGVPLMPDGKPFVSKLTVEDIRAAREAAERKRA